ncbi:MAG: DNA topoisomerase, partial [Candidatus Diapherotrites archaeon]
MKLIISEKAIAGRRIASILAGKEVPESHKGKSPAFEFKMDGEQFKLIPLRGHIVDVDFPKKYSYWIGTDLKQLVNAPIEYIGTEKLIVSELKASAGEALEVIVATDADREGEAIGLEAVNFLKEKNPKISVKRMYFSAITPKDIQNAFAKLTDLDYNFAESANARREIDLIWGAVLTRYLSLISGQLGKEYLSSGRVQTPVLRLIVDREKERRAFKPEKYWELKALLEKDRQKFEAMHK